MITKTNESIIIKHNFKVVVLEIRGNKVRLGVDAPQDVPVQREEHEAKIGRGYQVTWNVLPFSRAMADGNAPQNPRSLSRQVSEKAN